MTTELQEFSKQWERETQGTLALIDALPRDQYDYRPDAGGRSIGELAWHLAEVDAYVSSNCGAHGEERGDTLRRTINIGALGHFLTTRAGRPGQGSARMPSARRCRTHSPLGSWLSARE
jgi:hypothetical protein